MSRDAGRWRAVSSLLRTNRCPNPRLRPVGLAQGSWGAGGGGIEDGVSVLGWTEPRAGCVRPTVNSAVSGLQLSCHRVHPACTEEAEVGGLGVQSEPELHETPSQQ